MVVSTPRPRLTTNTAALVSVIDQYSQVALFVSLIEIHKLMYFLQEAGEDLKLRYQAKFYGPYAGFYCLEACVVAAALHLGLPPAKRTHPAKVEQARRLAAAHGLPDIDDLLVELNDRRKFEAYGDIELPEDEDGDAQDVAAEVRAYFEAVEAVLGP